MPFTKILCATDFSTSAEGALRVAVRLANEDACELVLTYVWHIPALMLSADSAYPANAIEGWVDDADKELARLGRVAADLGAKRVTIRRLTGVPWLAITGLLESDPEFDLVVLGTHGRTGFSRVLLGSVAEQVVRHAPCSVLAVRGDDAKPFTSVLCPIDFSAQSQRVIDVAAQVVRPGGFGITLFHVVEPPTVPVGEATVSRLDRELERRAAARLDQLAVELRAKVAVPVAVRACVGRAGADTVRVLDDAYDLAVLGSHGRTGIRRVLLGSVAEKVVRHAPCSVLVAR